MAKPIDPKHAQPFEDEDALAFALLKWGTFRRELDELEARVKATVLRLEKTQAVGSVRASFSKGRRSYDYPAGCKEATPEEIEAYSTKTVKIDWRGLYLNEVRGDVENLPFTQGKPSVSIRMLK